MRVPRKGLLADSTGKVHLIWSFEDPEQPEVDLQPWLVYDPVAGTAKTTIPLDAVRVVDLTSANAELMNMVHRDYARLRVVETAAGQVEIQEEVELGPGQTIRRPHPVQERISRLREGRSRV
jgi:hypothetical protein